jgi:hypothetical protein
MASTYWAPLPKSNVWIQCISAVRSQLPLRGSSGIGLTAAPDSLLSQPLKAGTAGAHKIGWQRAGVNVRSLYSGVVGCTRGCEQRMEHHQ